MRFVCENHPSLIISDLGVKFVNGEAEVDAAKAAELRKLPPELGVRQAGDVPENDLSDEDGQPATRRTRSPR